MIIVQHSNTILFESDNVMLLWVVLDAEVESTLQSMLVVKSPMHDGFQFFSLTTIGRLFEEMYVVQCNNFLSLVVC